MENDTKRKMTRQESLACAIAGARRKKEERLARELRDRGWTVQSPYEKSPAKVDK